MYHFAQIKTKFYKRFKFYNLVFIKEDWNNQSFRFV